MSDWSENLKPVASKSYAELLKTHGKQVGAAVEALEIARRRAEVDRTERDWRERHKLDLEGGEILLLDALNMFASLCLRFDPKRAVHILTGIERAHARAAWGKDLRSWRAMRGEMSQEAAANELGLSLEDVLAIEGQTFSAGPEVMRLVRPALRRVKSDLQAYGNII